VIVCSGIGAPTGDGIDVPEWECQQLLEPARVPSMQITKIGVDPAKSVFLLHGADHPSSTLNAETAVW